MLSSRIAEPTGKAIMENMSQAGAAEQAKSILLLKPRGFCAGVVRAIDVVKIVLNMYGAPIYVRKEIVHNKHVVEALQKKGAVTIEALTEAPEGSVVVFSAHGSPKSHYDEARMRKIRLIDATCPLVTKVHLEVQRFIKDGYQIIYIGHKGHIEGVGVLGEVPEASIPLIETVEDVERLDIGQSEKLVYLTQTTLSIDDTKQVIEALKKKYPQIIAPPLEDICYATTNRQGAVKALAQACDLVLIVGSRSSSNSTRLMETANACGTVAYLVDDVRELDPRWLAGVEVVGVSAGASAPEHLVSELVSFLTKDGAVVEDFIVKPETMKFAEPLELMQIRAAKNKS